MAKYRFTGDQEHVITGIPDPDGNGTWVAQPGDTIDLAVKQVPVSDDPDAETVTRIALANGDLIPVPDLLEPVAAKAAAPAKKAAGNGGDDKE